MRSKFSETLIQLAKADEKILLLTGDHGYALFDEFRKECSEQYINCGISEQNMVGVSAGLAKAGFRPIVYGLAAFIPIRVLEQIKIDVCYEELPVIFIGDGAGLVYSYLGSSHQSAEDIACLRAMPNINIFSPADMYEMKQVMQLSYESMLPSYIRMGKSDKPKIHHDLITFRVGDLIKIKEGDGLCAILATGSMVSTALEIALHIPEIEIWSAPCIKPINTSQIISVCSSNERLITLEEHSMQGGFGSVIAEISSEIDCSKLLRIGINDRFSEKCGSYDYLLIEHGIDVSNVCKQINGFISK